MANPARIISGNGSEELQALPFSAAVLLHPGPAFGMLYEERYIPPGRMQTDGKQDHLGNLKLSFLPIKQCNARDQIGSGALSRKDDPAPVDLVTLPVLIKIFCNFIPLQHGVWIFLLRCCLVIHIHHKTFRVISQISGKHHIPPPVPFYKSTSITKKVTIDI